MNIQWEIIPPTIFNDALQDWEAKCMTSKANQKNSEEHAFPKSLLDRQKKKKLFSCQTLASIINHDL